MTREDIARMAREAGVRMDYIFALGTTRWILQPGLMRFAALVAEAEREACAEICDAEATIEGIAQRCAAAIRARGSK